ncbi:MAG: MogA/MoaB family molybdenum cofactor biosynthesis protein [Bacillota bacterium]|nr:MogA/MoaB family molybdenum cofactor biosynthesis protein [Bacillota bacterium]MDD3299160.1 MogA/MoaB family molybdenum cofactor biosynthesis protein [Bacillota bacterium]MDD3851974.1 MogA/MoaB family molybdenum cofactor biosynthesis protein [Bacillota bacterium]MDD4708338.1 MogA/MoaB family molybdenum cofactor biosynthesis protein [Bacillota bacterium]
MFTIGIITVSDKGYAGQREDTSGPAIERLLETIGGKVTGYKIVPDDREKISKAIVHMTDDKGIDLVLTTGGTGFSPKDITPEATLAVIERQVPGIPEAMRLESLKHTPRAVLSRAVAGIRNKSLIINLPGSPKGATESLEVILPALPHGLLILQGKTGECGSP